MDYEKAYKDLKHNINQLREEVKEEYSQADDVLDELIDKMEQLEKENVTASKYRISKVTWGYDEEVCTNWTTGCCEYIDEHYIVTVVNVNNPLLIRSIRIEKFQFNPDEYNIGRIISI